ncbi:MAG: amidohydrolase family protein, partial [Pseudomonadota bacterium]
MKKIVLLVAIFASLFSIEGTCSAWQVITDINLDGRDGPQSILVKDGVIYSVGKQLDVPKDAVRIDGQGLYVIPGLAEMHGHTPVPQGDPDSDFVRDMMFLYVANGVTTVRGMLGGPGQLELRQRVDDGDVVGPTLFLAGPSFSGQSISSPAQATRRVKAQKQAGWDLLKVHPGLTMAEYDAMAIAARQQGIRFGGHVPQGVGLKHAIAMGQHTFDHIDGYLQQLNVPQQSLEPRQLAELVDLSRKSEVWIVPTLVLWDYVIGLGDADELIKHPGNDYWPQNQVRGWYLSMKNRQGNQATLKVYSQSRSTVLKALYEGGVGILMGTDSPQIFSVPGFSLHREMAAMHAAGMSTRAIIESGTENVAEYL